MYWWLCAVDWRRRTAPQARRYRDAYADYSRPAEMIATEVQNMATAGTPRWLQGRGCAGSRRCDL